MTGASTSNKNFAVQPQQPALSIIVPILNENELLAQLLAHLQQWQRKGLEVLLVDGGSSDGSAEIAKASGFTVLQAPRGRARQMNTGAASAKGAALVFLHADTRLPDDADRTILTALQSQHWGRFDVQISGGQWMLPVIAFFINCRSRLTGIATGDQAIFIRRESFAAIGGFPDQLLMEDIELSKRLNNHSRPACLRTRVVTSGRRWLTGGVWSTIWLMWRLRFAYWRGQAPEQLAKLYR